MHHLLLDFSTKSSTKRSFFSDDDSHTEKTMFSLLLPHFFFRRRKSNDSGSQSHIAFVGVKREGKTQRFLSQQFPFMASP